MQSMGEKKIFMQAENSESILGYKVINSGKKSCCEEIINWLQVGTYCRWLACLNPHSYVVALKDQGFSYALKEADILIPDGVGITLGSILLRGNITERVTGSDIFLSVLENMDRLGNFSVFFLGSTETTLALIRSRIAKDFPNVRLAGTYSPPFKEFYTAEELTEMIEAVNAASADLLWVGMTAPKQEKWIFENKKRLNVKFSIAVGAVFDFYGGQVRRSPLSFQRLGLEWLPRLIQQPKRLWRRTFISAPIFLWHVIKDKNNKA